MGDPLEPTRGILIAFDDYLESVYHLSDSELVSFDEETRKLITRHTFPDTPPDPDLFAAWVIQSTNQTAHRVLSTVLSDLSAAEATGSLLATTSPFIAELLGKDIAELSLAADIATLAAKLDLPILEDVSIENLAHIRTKEGEAFHRFRLLLSSKLRDLRSVNDEAQLMSRLKDLEHELTEIRIMELDLQFKKLKRDLSIPAGIVLAPFLTMIATSGINLPSLVGAGAVIVNGIYKLRSELRQNSAFFLWRLLRKGSAQ
jgi:hypothetical protein